MSQINLAKCFDVQSDMKKFLPRKKGYLTKALHSGQSSDKWSSGANVPPIHLASTYKIRDIENIVSQNKHKMLAVNKENLHFLRKIFTVDMTIRQEVVCKSA